MTEPRCLNPCPHEPHQWLADADAVSLSRCPGRAVPSAPATADLRERVAEALRPGSRDRSGAYPEGLLRDTDAVLAVLPAPADRAAVLREAADVAERVAEGLYARREYDRCDGALDVKRDLRRLADEGQQATARTACTGECDPTSGAYTHRAGCPDEAQQAAPRCTCADAGAEFAPAGHYADCPHADEAPPAPVEHCIHDRTVHAAHHRPPVDGCPWCTEPAPVKATPHRLTRDLPLPDKAQQAGEGR